MLATKNSSVSTVGSADYYPETYRQFTGYVICDTQTQTYAQKVLINNVT